MLSFSGNGHTTGRWECHSDSGEYAVVGCLGETNRGSPGEPPKLGGRASVRNGAKNANHPLVLTDSGQRLPGGVSGRVQPDPAFSCAGRRFFGLPQLGGSVSPVAEGRDRPSAPTGPRWQTRSPWTRVVGDRVTGWPFPVPRLPCRATSFLHVTHRAPDLDQRVG